MAPAPSSLAPLRKISTSRAATRYLTSSARSLSTTDNTKSVITETNASSNIGPLPSTPEWQQQIQTFWEQASGDAELRFLKDRVSKTSQEFDDAVRSVTQQRRIVEECQKTHEKVYQRHASLLMRREQWTPEEATFFVDITSQEVKARQALQDGRQELHNMEERASRLQHLYMDALRTKYQEEQAWQDRWRLLGTYGTWSLIGLNSLVFLLSQVLFYKRETRRLKDIENLIKDNLTPSNTVVVEEKDIPLSVSKEDETTGNGQAESTSNDDAPGKSEEKPQEIEARIGDDDSSTTTTKDYEKDNPVLIKLKEYKHEIDNNLHIPSATAGALVSASICIVLTVILSRR